MSILTKKLPDTVTVDGKQYIINTDFRIWIQFSELAFSTQSDISALAQIFTLVFEELPPNIRLSVEALINFYSFQKENASALAKKTTKKVFDYSSDAGYIYAAFLQQYGIDLTSVNMHWWTFKTLFDSISEETHFGKILQYRCIDISQIKDKEMKKFYQKMKQAYALPDSRTEAEKEQDFAESLESLF